MKPSHTPFAIAALVLAAAGTAGAQGTPPRQVNRDELRYCMDTGDAIKARSDAIAARSQKVRADQEALKAENDELKQEQDKQEQNSTLMGMGRERLQRRMRAFNEKVAASRAEGEKLGPEADTLRADLAAYNQRCDGISYERADREAILKEREAAGRK